MCADFVETIRLTLSPDNDKRNAAERAYEESKTSQGAQTVVGLFGIVQEASLEQALREQGAVLLRQCMQRMKDDGSVWLQLGEAGQADVKAQALRMLEAEGVPQIRRKLADVVQTIGNQVADIPEGERPTNVKEWPELMPSLMRIIVDGSKDGGLRADCLWAVKEMACNIWQILVASSDQTMQVLRVTLGDAHEAVRAYGAVLLLELAENVDSKQDRAPLATLTPEVCALLTQLADSKDAKHLNAVLQCMQSGTETAELFKDHLASTILPVMSTIAKSHSDDESRRYAFEVIIALVESKPKTCARVPNYLSEAFGCAVHFLMETDDDMEAWAAELDEEAEDEPHFTYGRDAVDRVCRAMGRIDSFPVALDALKPIITTLFQDGDWKKVVAGVSIIAQIAEYVDDEATVLQMVGAVRAQLGGSNPRVRFCAWSAVAQFGEDHGEILSSDAMSAELLPIFLQGMDDPCPRVALRAMEAFQHFGESLERENLEPFVPAMMEKLGARLQGDSLPFQKRSITFIAVIAGQIDDSFAPYYPQLMPILKKIIETILHRVEERTLLGKCFECISLLAKSVGRAGFKADAEAIMTAMLTATQAPNLPSNDPVKEYMMAASERICQVMKEDFLPFVPHLLPGVFEKLTLAPKEFEKHRDDFEDGEEVNLTLVPGEGGKMKVMIMNSSEMEDLKNALDCIHTFAHELGKLYFPHVAQTAQALLPVFDFNMAEEIRDLAFETWGELCASCRLADTQGGSVLNELTMEFMKRILPKFEETPVEARAFRTRADGITTCLRKAGPGVLKVDELKHISSAMMKVLEESFKRREASGPQDEDDEDDDMEANLRVALMEVAGAMMEHHADIFAAELLQPYLACVQKLIAPSACEEDRKLALFVACDFLEHLGTKITPHWPAFLPQLVENIAHQSTELRQPACYGVSLAAKDPAFAPMALDVANKLAQLVTSTRSRPKKKSEKPAQAAADNALSALVELLSSHQASLAPAEQQLWAVWLGGLPCQEDDDEGRKNHKLLLSLVAAEKPEVVGAGGESMGAVLQILVDVYKSEMASEETSKGIGELVARLGQARLEGLSGSLSEKQKKKLLRIYKEASS